jgi:hypothetical protein
MFMKMGEVMEWPMAQPHRANRASSSNAQGAHYRSKLGAKKQKHENVKKRKPSESKYLYIYIYIDFWC